MWTGVPLRWLTDCACGCKVFNSTYIDGKYLNSYSENNLIINNWIISRIIRIWKNTNVDVLTFTFFFLRFPVDFVLVLKFAKSRTSGQTPSGRRSTPIMGLHLPWGWADQPEEAVKMGSDLRRGPGNRRRAKLRARSSGCPAIQAIPSLFPHKIK